MTPQTPSDPIPPLPETQAERWHALLVELRVLTTRLEYARLMLRLGVGPSANPRKP